MPMAKKPTATTVTPVRDQPAHHHERKLAAVV